MRVCACARSLACVWAHVIHDVVVVIEPDKVIVRRTVAVVGDLGRKSCDVL